VLKRGLDDQAKAWRRLGAHGILPLGLAHLSKPSGTVRQPSGRFRPPSGTSGRLFANKFRRESGTAPPRPAGWSPPGN
jgi:hypothetical protein